VKATGFESLLGDFTLETAERIERVEQVLLNLATHEGEARESEIALAKRELHTLKGNAGMMGLSELQETAHQMEDALDPSRSDHLDVAGLLQTLDVFRSRVAALASPAQNPRTTASATEGEPGTITAPASVRVPFAMLDPLMDLIGEMVILRNRMSQAITEGSRLPLDASDFAARSAETWTDVQLAYEALSRTLDFVQDRVMRLRMTPLRTVLGSLRRLVHDEAVKEHKEARLETLGGDTPLDKALLELAGEVLGHMVRNAVVHGLESPADRMAAGKPRVGTIRVSASAKGDEVRIQVTDDGAGIDREALERAAASRGLRFDTANPFALLFEAGVTTRELADMSAGRGVGLSAVREAVQRQGGEIEVTSEAGRGCTFLLRLPLTVSIARAMLLEADREIYAVPLSSIMECCRLEPGDGHEVNAASVLRWHGGVLTLLDLGCQFGTAAQARDAGYVVVIEAFGRRRGLVVDAILGVQEVVVKALDPIVGQPIGVAGSTLLGDGRPILILDTRKLVEVEPFVKERP